MPPGSILDRDDQKLSQTGELPSLKSLAMQNVPPTPDRILDFLRQYQQASKYLNDDEKLKLKQEFLNQEKKHVRKDILDRFNLQEQRKKVFLVQLRQFETQLKQSQLEAKQQYLQQKLNEMQDYELQIREIRQMDVKPEHKKVLLQKLLNQVNMMISGAENTYDSKQ